MVSGSLVTFLSRACAERVWFFSWFLGMSSARAATLLSYAIEKNTRIQVLTCHRAHDVNDENWVPSLGTSVTSAHCSRSGCIFSYFRLYGADFIRVFCVRVLAAVITNNFVPIYTLLTEFLLGFRPTPRFLYVFIIWIYIRASWDVCATYAFPLPKTAQAGIGYWEFGVAFIVEIGIASRPFG